MVTIIETMITIVKMTSIFFSLLVIGTPLFQAGARPNLRPKRWKF